MQPSNFKRFFAIALIFAIVNASDGSKRIVGGAETNIESLPYTVSIEVLDNKIYYHECGGSLIFPNWVISAAQCFKPNKKYFVRAGISNINQTGGERRRVKLFQQIIPYHGPGTMGDIMLIQLESPLPINKKIQTIPLPPPSTGDIPLGMAIASGWGNLAYGKGELKYANLPILDETSCRIFGKIRIKEDLFCAGYIRGVKGLCKGDFGGPLVLNGTLYGVMSMTSRKYCEIEHSMGIFVKVPYYVPNILYTISTTP